jgi:hypothetical protein
VNICNAFVSLCIKSHVFQSLHFVTVNCLDIKYHEMFHSASKLHLFLLFKCCYLKKEAVLNFTYP